MTNFQGFQRNFSFVDFHLITAMFFFYLKKSDQCPRNLLVPVMDFFLKCLKDAEISYDAKLLLNAISYVFR